MSLKHDFQLSEGITCPFYIFIELLEWVLKIECVDSKSKAVRVREFLVLNKQISKSLQLRKYFQPVSFINYTLPDFKKLRNKFVWYHPVNMFQSKYLDEPKYEGIKIRLDGGYGGLFGSMIVRGVLIAFFTETFELLRHNNKSRQIEYFPDVVVPDFTYIIANLIAFSTDWRRRMITNSASSDHISMKRYLLCVHPEYSLRVMGSKHHCKQKGVIVHSAYMNDNFHDESNIEYYTYRVFVLQSNRKYILESNHGLIKPIIFRTNVW